MHAKEGIKLIGGSIAVYLIMAACSAASGPLGSSSGDAGSGHADGTASTSGGTGGSSAGGGTAGDGSGSGGAGDGPSILDAITDPVSEAKADPNQSGTRLKVNYYAGTDGSTQPTGSMHDSMLNVDCYFSKASDGTMRCMPIATATTAYASYYTDAACTHPIALVSQCAGTTIPTQVIASIGSEGATQTFALGSVTTASTVYYLAPAADPTACSPGGVNGYTYICTAYPASAWATVQTNSTIYGVGAPIQPPSPSTFVEATIQAEP
jgi:hypothetical protein